MRGAWALALVGAGLSLRPPPNLPPPLRELINHSRGYFGLCHYSVIYNSDYSLLLGNFGSK